MQELEYALTQGADGVILLDRRGAPSFVNAVAVDILDAGDGLFLSRGLIGARRLPESRKLARHIRDVIDRRRAAPIERRRSMLVTRPSAKRPYVVSVMVSRRVLSHPVSPSCACVVHIHDLAHQREPADDALRQTFGFTKRETDLAIQLVRSPRLDAAARRSGMAVNTARNHLRGIFLKLGTASQSEAVQLLSKIPGPEGAQFNSSSIPLR
jgi:DNA-binding CsgD family transcriptional regulator